MNGRAGEEAQNPRQRRDTAIPRDRGISSPAQMDPPLQRYFHRRGLFGEDLASKAPAFRQPLFAEPDPVHRVDRGLPPEYSDRALPAVAPAAACGQDMDVLTK